jgi:hypothetical protein
VRGDDIFYVQSTKLTLMRVGGNDGAGCDAQAVVHISLNRTPAALTRTTLVQNARPLVTNNKKS